jgi:hypothetical protein
VIVKCFVQRPRRNEISNTTHLINLMALACSATADGAMNDLKLTRVTEAEGCVRVSKFQMNLEDISKLT